MQDADLLLSLAGIAGVFVGFAALISVRSGGASEAHGITWIRWVVVMGVWVIIAGIAPVIVSRYGITGHELWLVCGVLSLVLYLGLWFIGERTTEAREVSAAMSRTQGVVVVASMWAFTGPMIVALALIVLGLFPEQEPALYLTAVGLVLSMGAFSLLFLVLSQGPPQPVSDRAGLPAPGGPSPDA